MNTAEEYKEHIKSSPWVSENGCRKYGKGQWSWWIGGYAGFTRSFWLRANQGPDGSGTLHFTIIRLYPYSTHIGREITNVLREHWWFLFLTFSPHICGYCYFVYSWQFDQSKDKCPITSETLLWILCSLRSNDIQANWASVGPGSLWPKMLNNNVSKWEGK